MDEGIDGDMNGEPTGKSAPMRLKLISCQVFYRELCYAVSRSPHVVDLEFLPKALHDLGCKGMRARIQEAVDRADSRDYDAILLGYGLCNNGLSGIRARDLPLVLPRSHDCIGVFMGGRERYIDYFETHPGAYFKTSGWIERSDNHAELSQLSIQRQNGMDMSLEELTAKYGEENARYLYETLGVQTRHYNRLAFIEMGVEPDDRFERASQTAAQEKGWSYEKLPGDMRLLLRLTDGPWDDKDFLTVQPGEKIMHDYGEGIVAAIREEDRPAPV